MSTANPFQSGTNPMTGEPTERVSTHDRVQLVRGFTYRQCLAALEVPGLQASVATAVRSRMRQIIKKGD
ncbi:hypothetical protein [Ralstonia sp.]|uniref:hypothetical protein n=1 Tax=Ralstonia sp. TaxID=54061 RepID=UPI003978E683